MHQQLLFALGQQPSTVSPIAAQLDAKRSDVAHHLKLLREAGLVRVTETRQVRAVPSTTTCARPTTWSSLNPNDRYCRNARRGCPGGGALTRRDDPPDTAPAASQPPRGKRTRRDPNRTPRWGRGECLGPTRARRAGSAPRARRPRPVPTPGASPAELHGHARPSCRRAGRTAGRPTSVPPSP
ncbi:ArsR family transcriptional regulator [Streptomyces sp. NPDC006544]|uniref:ArsR family transcriptional regulator n=1 Tax=Streptomyces sp. NPDC006544 TaxID=3154583 RepID=UPI0033BC58CD